MKRLLAPFGLLLVLGPVASAQICGASGLGVTFTPAHPQPGQTIQIKVTNLTAACQYTIPSSCLYTAVFTNDCNGIKVVPFRACSVVPVPLPPGASYSDTWDQKDWKGVPVPTGTYAFRVEVKDPTGQSIVLCPTVAINLCTPPPAFYGNGSQGAGGFVPGFVLTGAPTVGNSNFAISLVDALGGAPALMIVGAKPTVLPAPFGEFLIDPNFPMLPLGFTLGGPPGQPGGGQVTFAIPIPNQPVLLGVNACFQAFVADAASSGGIATTAGLQLFVCQ